MNPQPLADAAVGAEAVALAPAPEPWLPPGGPVELLGRGTSFGRDSGAPFPGAPTVLLLHGWAVTADLNFFAMYEALAERYRVITIDHRGHGRGIRPANGIVTLPACTDDAMAMLDARGVDRAVVVGYSMGGAIAQLAWYRHRDRVDALVLASTARHFQGGPLSDLWYRSYTPLAHLAHAATGPADAMVRWRIDRRVGGDPRADWMRAELARVSPAGLLSAMRSVGRFSSTRWIGDLDLPASVVITTRDRTIPARGQRRLAAALPHATSHDVDGPHDSIVTRADEYRPALLAALDDVTAPRPAP
jgi:3-oxoadipate enol-lactonase